MRSTHGGRTGMSVLAPILIGAVLIGAACNGGSSPTPKGTLTIADNLGELWPCTFNPFVASNAFVALGVIYEPLVYINALNGRETPWLASAYTWSNDNRTLTFKIRNGVKWSDGESFSAADVLYTFNFIKKNSSLDLQAVWSELTSVDQQGQDKIVMSFNQPAATYFYYVADLVGIVPQHIWSTIVDPVKYADTVPIGTGPYTVQQCSPENITYIRNSNYWQPGKPLVDKVLDPAFTDGDATNLMLAQGKADWGGQAIPSMQSFYLDKDKNNHVWVPPSNGNFIFPNLTSAPLNNKTFRQALSYAINRDQVSKEGGYGYELAANQSGIVLPTFNSWYDSAQAANYGYGYHPDKALQLLGTIGYTKGQDGLLHQPNGKALTLTMISSTFSDWVASVDTVKANFKQIGIGLDVSQLDYNTYLTRLYNGDFQLAWGQEPSYGPAPYYELKNALFGSNSAPIGKPASGNYERWRDDKTDQLIKQYSATPATDLKTQRDLIGQLEGIMLENVPIIPVTEACNWSEYSTKRFTNWPTETNQYAAPAPYTWPDWAVVLVNLQPV